MEEDGEDWESSTGGRLIDDAKGGPLILTRESWTVFAEGSRVLGSCMQHTRPRGQSICVQKKLNKKISIFFLGGGGYHKPKITK